MWSFMRNLESKRQVIPNEQQNLQVKVQEITANELQRMGHINLSQRRQFTPAMNEF
jgi:hypothetical protein